MPEGSIVLPLHYNIEQPKEQRDIWNVHSTMK